MTKTFLHMLITKAVLFFGYKFVDKSVCVCPRGPNAGPVCVFRPRGGHAEPAAVRLMLVSSTCWAAFQKAFRKEQDVCLKDLCGLMTLLIGEMTVCVFVSAGVCNERINSA